MMNMPISELLRPILQKANQRPVEEQVALEVFLAELQSELAKQAVAEVQKMQPQESAYHFLTLVLRHPHMQEWRAFLAKEKARGRKSKELAESLLKWMKKGKSSPVGRAFVEARSRTRGKYQRASGRKFSLKGPGLLEGSREAALREFLAQMLRRLAR